MSEFQSVGAVRRGFVRGVVSSRLGGVAFPADLVRVAARIARRDGARRRVASAFAGYLVTDAGPDAGHVHRDDAGRVLVLLATGPRCHGLRGGVVVAAEVGALDAPEFLPGGSVQREDDLAGFVAVQRLVLRGGWSL